MISITRSSIMPVMMGLWHCVNEKCFDCPYRKHGKERCRRVLMLYARNTLGVLADELFQDGEGRDKF